MKPLDGHRARPAGAVGTARARPARAGGAPRSLTLIALLYFAVHTAPCLSSVESSSFGARPLFRPARHSQDIDLSPPSPANASSPASGPSRGSDRRFAQSRNDVISAAEQEREEEAEVDSAIARSVTATRSATASAGRHSDKVKHAPLARRRVLFARPPHHQQQQWREEGGSLSGSFATEPPRPDSLSGNKVVSVRQHRHEDGGRAISGSGGPSDENAAAAADDAGHQSTNQSNHRPPTSAAAAARGGPAAGTVANGPKSPASGPRFESELGARRPSRARRRAKEPPAGRCQDRRGAGNETAEQGVACEIRPDVGRRNERALEALAYANASHRMMQSGRKQRREEDAEDNEKSGVLGGDAEPIPDDALAGSEPDLEEEEEVEEEDGRLRDYDDMFLLHDYRPRLTSAARRRIRSQTWMGNPLESELPVADKMSQVQTIYFGGFFPWLADRRGQLDPPALDERAQSRRRQWEGDGRHLSHKQDMMGSSYDSYQFAERQQQAASSTAASTSAAQYTNSETRHQLGKFILPAVRLALDHINTNRSILSAYKLEVVPRDTQCNATISLKQFFDMVYEEPKKMLLYGDACRVSTDPIAKASYFFDLIQISYADTDPIYTIENYPNFFRVVPSENALSLARIPFIRHFNWTRVGTIYQNLPRYSLPHSKLLTDLERFKIVIKQSVSLPGSVDGLQNRDLGDELRKLKERDVRIILGNFDEEWALLLFCEAYREKMIGRKYQWLLTGFSEAKLWHFYENKNSSCSKQELLIAMDGYIITDITPVTRSQHRTISGLMAHEYLSEYQKRAREMSISIEENKFYGYVYDGIWAIALALNRVDQLLRYYNKLAREGKVRLKPEFDEIGSLLDFEYHKPIWVRLIRDALNATRFEGVTGTVSFQKNERPGLITFSQFQAFRDMNEVIIGSYDALKDRLDLNVGFPIIWRGSSPPIDYTIQRVTPFRINRTLFVIISILALLGIVLACVFLFINIKFRNQRYIKMSSPYLNNLIIIGCILTFTSVIILGLDSGLTSEYNFPYICNARAWVLMAGFTLAFGSMFSKTFRVHSIFTNIKLHKKVIKDYKLFMVVFILLTFDVCILIVWQYFDPFYRETNNGTSIQDPDNEDVIIVPEMEHCQSKRMTIFLSVIYVYKGLLMAFGCFLAWETRHVSIPALNDSKYIGLSVYNVVIMCVIGASLSFILRDQQDASFVIISIFIIFCSTTTLCLVFVPKLIELKQNPRASDHRVRATLKTLKKNYHDEPFAAGCRDIHGNIIGRGYGMNLNDRIKLLADENGKQRSLLKEKTYELEALTSKYRKIQSMVQSGQFLQAINTSASATASPSTLQPQSSGLVQSSSVGLFSSGTGQTTVNTLGAPTTTVLLTSRSPTRERVSFSTTLDANPDRALLPTSANAVSSPIAAPADEPIKTNGLRSSPMMSSITQITNTTSSTMNNTTDLTADFSSNSKAYASGATTSSGTCAGLRTVHSNDCKISHDDDDDGDDDTGSNLGERVQAISRQVAASRQQQRQRQQQRGNATVSLKGGRAVHNEFEDFDKKTMLCSGEKQRLFRSQDDLSLFTILSYVKGSQLRQPNEARRRPVRPASEDLDDQSSKLGQWLEGPFCTVLLRQTSLDLKRQPAVLRGGPQAEQRERYARFRKQYSHQADSTPPSMRPTKSMLMSQTRDRLPRTLSMIEYLGLNDFDMIARRHDKILRHRRRMVAHMSCCASCSCCLSHHQSNPKIGELCQSQTMTFEGNWNNNYSSSCEDVPLNYSDELVQTTSLASCSTCCSLTSQTYPSNSEIDYQQHYRHQHQLHRHHLRAHNDLANSMLSSSSGSSRSSNGLGLGTGSSSAMSSSKSESSSIVIGGTLKRSCGDHQYETHSEGGISSSQSSRSLFVEKSAIKCPLHNKREQAKEPANSQTSRLPSCDAAAARPVRNSGPHHCRPTETNMQTQSAPKQATSSTEPPSLCTSGQLFGAPGMKDDANQAAAFTAPMSPDGLDQALEVTQSVSSIAETDSHIGSVGNEANNTALCDDTKDSHACRSATSISIECDILEEL